MADSAGFVGGDPDVLADVGRRTRVVEEELGDLTARLRAAAGRASASVGHRAAAGALEGCSATWCAGLAALAVQVAAVAALASNGGDDLRRADR